MKDVETLHIYFDASFFPKFISPTLMVFDSMENREFIKVLFPESIQSQTAALPSWDMYVTSVYVCHISLCMISMTAMFISYIF